MLGSAWAGSIERIRRCLTARGRRQQGLYTFEGERLLQRALSSDVEIAEIVIGEEPSRRLSLGASRLGGLVHEATERGARTTEAPVEVLRQLAEGRNSGQVVVLAKLPPPASIEVLLQQHHGETALLLIAVDIDEPGNVGALARTALCSGVSGFVALGATDPFHPKAVRTSMGSIFKLPWSWSADAPELMVRFARARVHQVAAIAERGTPLAAADLGAGRLALYVGNEARGLPSEVSDALDERVTIVMPPGVDSFSVNAAAAIVLYEANRRRTSRVE